MYGGRIKRIIGGFLIVIFCAAIALAQTATVRSWRATLRSGPSTRHSKVDTLYQGYTLKILQKKRSWYKVSVIDPPDGGEGWVHRRLIK